MMVCTTSSHMTARSRLEVVTGGEQPANSAAALLSSEGRSPSTSTGRAYKCGQHRFCVPVGLLGKRPRQRPMAVRSLQLPGVRRVVGQGLDA
jgi:hypothetical protein